MTTPTATTTTATAAPTTIWLTDRSRYLTGTARCPRQRYLSYHFGPTGYGITRKSEALPLVTGLAVHEGLEAFALLMKETDRLPDVHETRAIIAQVVAHYIAKVEARGYRGILGGEHTEE